MTKRTDIIDGQDIRTPNGAFKKYGLIYTKYAGWIDLGHANPASASSLWGDITTSTTSWMCLNRPNELVTIMYKQSMRKWSVERGITQRYGLAKQLTVDEQRSIALAIFMDVSIAFEGFQSSLTLSPKHGHSKMGNKPQGVAKWPQEHVGNTPPKPS
jgi:hypothetical protein